MKLSHANERARGGLAEIRTRLQSRSAATAAFVMLIVACFLFGGGARTDIQSLLLLRPLSFLLLGFALLHIHPGQMRDLGVPVWLLGLLFLLIVLQLAPLPPSLWQSLPGRSIIVTNDADVFGHDIWRPLSLAPSKTLNSLLSLGVPLAAMTLFVRQNEIWRDRVPLLLVTAGVGSCVLGILQVIGPPTGAFYTYRITNNGMFVGLFANRNHNAMFLASLIPLTLWIALRAKGERAGFERGVALAVAAFFVPMVFATGSRTGSVLLLASIAGSTALWLATLAPGTVSSAVQKRKWLVTFLAAASVIIVAATIYLFMTSAVFDRLFDRSVADELRWKVLPDLWAMLGKYFPVGTGFGTFYLVYRIDEPVALLMPQYLNQAHNDVLQPLIEGGLPAALLMVTALLWLAVRGWQAAVQIRHRRHQGQGHAPLAPFAWLALAILLLGSATDYPLRAPAIMCSVALLAAVIETRMRNQKS